MTDAELLVAAAKAAGIEVELRYEENSQFRGLLLKEWKLPGTPAFWNPLTDDGDALRLAVKLRMRVCCPTTDSDCALASNGDITAYSEDKLTDTPMADLYAATRRAIVRAAAEIGKAMK